MYDRPMDRNSEDLSAFILAGGKSTRMGADKAFVQLHGQTLLARSLHLARSITSKVAIVGSASKFSAFPRVVEDRFPECGPLGGIHAALMASPSQLNVIVAVDIPFISKELLQFLVECARNSCATVTVPCAGGRLQPLCAVYCPEFGGVAEEALKSGHYKIDALFDKVTVRVVEEDALVAAGFTAPMFRNLNTKEDLQQAVEAAQKTS